MPATMAVQHFATGLLVERVKCALQESFEQEFDLWLPGQAFPYEEAADSVGSLKHLWEIPSGPRIVSGEDGTVVLAVPIVHQYAIVAMALTRIASTASPRLLVQTARLVLENLHAQDEIEQLHDENREHLIQVTQDFEELTFLRNMSEHLEMWDVSHDMWSLARTVLPLLRHSIRAQSLVLVAAPNGKNATLDAKRPLLWVGPQVMTDEDCVHLVRRHMHEAVVQTVVRNRRVTGLERGERGLANNLILVPLARSGRVFGWLLALNRLVEGDEPDRIRWALSQHEFGTSQASLLESAASALAAHAVNVELIKDKEKLLTNVVCSLVSSIEAKDEYTRGHSERVALFAQSLARNLGFSEEACQRLYLTGLVHDVGKIGVSDSILKKETPLTDEEFEEIKRHPDEGWAILRGLDQLNYVLPGVLHHHERYDGRGYPDGLAGENIPIDGRIIAVADAYDAMTSDRPYRAGMTHERAEEILRNGAGQQWDPAAIDAFFAVREEILRLKSCYRAEPRPVRLPQERTSTVS